MHGISFVNSISLIVGDKEFPPDIFVDCNVLAVATRLPEPNSYAIDSINADAHYNEVAPWLLQIQLRIASLAVYTHCLGTAVRLLSLPLTLGHLPFRVPRVPGIGWVHRICIPSLHSMALVGGFQSSSPLFQFGGTHPGGKKLSGWIVQASQQ